jgi:hypothetical protein
MDNVYVAYVCMYDHCDKSSLPSLNVIFSPEIRVLYNLLLQVKEPKCLCPHSAPTVEGSQCIRLRDGKTVNLSLEGLGRTVASFKLLHEYSHTHLALQRLRSMKSYLYLDSTL